MATGLNTSQIQGKAKDLGISLSEQEAGDILNKTFDQSIFGADPGRVESLLKQRRSPASVISSFSGKSPVADFSSAVAQARKLQQEATQPAIESLKAGIPEVQQRFSQQRETLEAKKTPLKERYQNLLDEVTGKAKVSEEAQTRITSGELGKRGIVGSSTLAQQEIQDAVEPIRSGLRTATKDIGIAQEEGLQGIDELITNLTGDETSAVRAISNAIAQLQSGAGQNAISSALSLLGLGQQQQSLEQSQRQAQEARDFQQRVFEQISLPESQANLKNIYDTIAKRGAGSDLSASDFISLFSGGLGGGLGSTGLMNTSSNLPGNVQKLFNEGNIDEAINLYFNP